MTRIRRATVLLTSVAAVLLGSALPADARFADSAATPTMAISTVDVLAPTDLSTSGTTCDSYWALVGWRTTLSAKLRWNPSPTRGITGYRVTAYFDDGTVSQLAETGAATTTLTGSYAGWIRARNVQFTVTTLTSYGWTEESGLSGAIKC